MHIFITVPTQKDIGKFKASSASVLRVQNLTGGNFWGCQTRSGIANSAGEIFNRNFMSGYDTSYSDASNRIIEGLKNDLELQQLFQVKVFTK